MFENKKIERSVLESFDARQENHFFDRKSSKISPAKISQSISAFANADGGELLVGVEDDLTWNGFKSIESANSILDLPFNLLKSRYFHAEFLSSDDFPGFVLHLSIERSPSVIYSTSNDAYIRNNASNRKAEGDRLDTLRRSKGDITYESHAIKADINDLANSETMIRFMLESDRISEPVEFLRKQGLLIEGKPTVAALLLYSDHPQAQLPQGSVKIYRYETSGEAQREFLSSLPMTIEGSLYSLIEESERTARKIIDSIPRLDQGSGLTKIEYPAETLHEILTNAVLHRDYGSRDYVHIKIFDNRVEVESPGRLPANITPQNILDERFARNPLIQRGINRFPFPPNMDIGEGLNTAFQAMEKLRLSMPFIEETGDHVRVTIPHEPLASPQEAIVNYVKDNGRINNTTARGVTKIEQERTIRRFFTELVDAGELVQRGSGRGTYYEIP
ncbi:Divergent AAA domain protein [Rhodococcus erythropolis]|uniref:ATP-binding protein n=1 Tax=Rhodococcus erythropolis TaxID=1833 RepID=UPI000BB3AC5F|nr:ATP-binding protein [Rhodococcus erythropolis]PBI96357.1 Divergent AAA domain protein [Rhodococcus erythropolis]